MYQSAGERSQPFLVKPVPQGGVTRGAPLPVALVPPADSTASPPGLDPGHTQTQDVCFSHKFLHKNFKKRSKKVKKEQK